MELMHARCAGMDVHKKTVVVCARIQDGGKVRRETETFPATTKGLLALGDWLAERECTHVAMESTGVYWKPIWHLLEGQFELVLGNAQHIRNVPGRKTDVNDAQWLAELLAHGLIRGSFVPPAPLQEIRDLTRTRKQLMREAAQHAQRIEKVLEDANLKITSVVSDILGMSGRAILDALVRGETDPERLADLGGRLKAPRATLVEALNGRVTDHHRFLLKLHLGQVDATRCSIGHIDSRLEAVLDPFREYADLLTTIPGISDVAAHVILGEIGTDMSRFPTSGHLISWAGLCPRNDESAGKRRSNRVRKGDTWLKTTLVQAAWAATRTKNTYLSSQFHRIRGRRGPKKAILAVAASILTAAYHMIRDGVEYRDLGPDHFGKIDVEKTTRRLVLRLEALGHVVTLQEAVEEAAA